MTSEQEKLVNCFRYQWAERFSNRLIITDENILECIEVYESRGEDVIIEAMYICNERKSNVVEMAEPEQVEPEYTNGIVSYQGELVIDIARGVVYFHDGASGITRLRICGLNAERLNQISNAANGFLPDFFSLDIAKPERVSYSA